MAGLRIAAVFYLVVATSGLAQTVEGRIFVEVTDTAGEIVPGAGVFVDSWTEGAAPSAVSDKNGWAIFTAPMGTHKLLVRSPGFETWVRTIDVQANNEQPIVAAMNVSPTIDPVVVDVLDVTIPLEHRILNEFVPYVTIEELLTIRTAHNS